MAPAATIALNMRSSILGPRKKIALFFNDKGCIADIHGSKARNGVQEEPIRVILRKFGMEQIVFIVSLFLGVASVGLLGFTLLAIILGKVDV